MKSLTTCHKCFNPRSRMGSDAQYREIELNKLKEKASIYRHANATMELKIRKTKRKLQLN